MINLYKKICQKYERLGAAKLIVDEELVHFEDKNQQLEVSSMTLDEEIIQVEKTNQELLEKLDAQEETILVDKLLNSYSFFF